MSSDMKKLEIKRLTKPQQLQFDIIEGESTYWWRPKTRADCEKVVRPCPYVGCRYNLYLAITHQGSGVAEQLAIQRRGGRKIDPSEMVESCALDVADRGDPLELDVIGNYMGFTRERARQIEAQALRKIRGNPRVLKHLREIVD